MLVIGKTLPSGISTTNYFITGRDQQTQEGSLFTERISDVRCEDVRMRPKYKFEIP